MKIGRKDFDKGHSGNVYQAVWQAVPEEEAVDEAELRAAYDQANDLDKPSFEELLKNLASELERREINGGTYYIHRKRWLTSSDVAHRLGVSKRTVQSWAQQGKLLGQKVGQGISSHRRIRFDVDAVDDMMHSNVVPDTYGSELSPSNQGARVAVVVADAPAEVWDNTEDAAYDRI